MKKQGSAFSQEKVQGKMVALTTNGKWMNKSFFGKKKEEEMAQKKKPRQALQGSRADEVVPPGDERVEE